MKKNNVPYASIGILLGVIIIIIALVRGKWQYNLTMTVLALWGIWLAVVLLIPYLKNYKRCWDRKKQEKKRHREGISGKERSLLTDPDHNSLEQLLLRHVNHRISAYLRSAYPDMTWEWCEKAPEKIILQGGAGRIRVFGVPDYDHADIKIDQQANISCDMVKIVPLNTSDGQISAEDKVPPNKQPVDPQIWYEMQGRKVLEALVADLNSRGHSHMVLHEDGDVCVMEDRAEVAKEHLDNFPKKVYWDRLVQVFERNGLAAAITASGIQVSW